MNDPKWKYNEDKILAELRDYLASTYGAHYAGSDNVQAIDLIKAGGMLIAFSASSIIKYAFRFGRKDGQNRKDVLKIIHYAMFILYGMDTGGGVPETRVITGPPKIFVDDYSGNSDSNDGPYDRH